MSHFVYSFLAFPAKHALSLQTFNIFSISALPQKTSEGYPLPFNKLYNSKVDQSTLST